MPTPGTGWAIQREGGSELKADASGDLVILVVFLAQGSLVKQESLDTMAEYGAGARTEQEIVGILLVRLVGEAIASPANRVGEQPATNGH